MSRKSAVESRSSKLNGGAFHEWDLDASDELRNQQFTIEGHRQVSARVSELIDQSDLVSFQSRKPETRRNYIGAMSRLHDRSSLDLRNNLLLLCHLTYTTQRSRIINQIQNSWSGLPCPQNPNPAWRYRCITSDAPGSFMSSTI